MDKHCLDCGEKISGRSDKKFCNDICRNNYNNHLNSDVSAYMKNVNNLLRKNRRILSAFLTGTDGKAKVSLRQLEEKGFNFSYHTHTYTTKTGNHYRFCYELGYLPLENQYFMIVKRDADRT